MITSMVVGLLSSYPEFTLFLSAMGFARTINKPLFALIQAAVDSTDTDTDNKWWNKVQEHKVMKSVFWLLDWTASIKMPKGK